MKIKSRMLVAGLLVLAAVAFTGCVTEPPSVIANAGKGGSDLVILREGDTVKISFPSAPNLDATQQIRRDGKISLSLVGEVDAVGLTPDGLREKLAALVGPQIGSKEVNVALQTSTFPVFVNGSVMRPGKILSDHPITALEAVMEAGGFNSETANMKAVKVSRIEDGKYKNYQLNLKEILDGKNSQPFYLKPGDIVFVPERFQMF
jgi:polysaccharide export outer membrane protein